jgi:hypothetical protein
VGYEGSGQERNHTGYWPFHIGPLGGFNAFPFDNCASKEMRGQ